MLTLFISKEYCLVISLEMNWALDLKFLTDICKSKTSIILYIL